MMTIGIHIVAIRKAHKGYKLGPLMTFHSGGLKYTTYPAKHSYNCSHTLGCNGGHDIPSSHH